jgi:hypothetical protein
MNEAHDDLQIKSGGQKEFAGIATNESPITDINVVSNRLLHTRHAREMLGILLIPPRPYRAKLFVSTPTQQCTLPDNE